MFRTVLLIAIGGGIGSVLRYGTTIFIGRYFSGIFPLATFITNVLGCFLIGLIAGILTKAGIAGNDARFFFITGFCGGFTTFSAFGLENIALMQENHFPTALLYTALSVIIGLMAVWLGLFAAR